MFELTKRSLRKKFFYQFYPECQSKYTRLHHDSINLRSYEKMLKIRSCLFRNLYLSEIARKCNVNFEIQKKII